MALADILSGIGDVLSAPRRLLYKGLISPLMGQEVEGFGDVLDKLGMEEGGLRSTLGFLGDLGTDPLTYAGAGLFKYGKGLLGEGAATAKALEGGAATNPGGLLAKASQPLEEVAIAKSAPTFEQAAASARKLDLSQAAENRWGNVADSTSREIEGITGFRSPQEISILQQQLENATLRQEAARAAATKHMGDALAVPNDPALLSQLGQRNAQRYASLGEMVGKGETGTGLAQELAKAQGEHGLLGLLGMEGGAPAAAKTEFAQTLFPKMVESGGLRDLAGETKLSNKLYDMLRAEGARNSPVVKSLLTPDMTSQLGLQDMLRTVDRSRSRFHRVVDQLTGYMGPPRRYPNAHLPLPDVGLGSLTQGL